MKQSERIGTNHAEDAYLFIDAANLPLIEQLAPRLRTLKGYVLMADRVHMPANSMLREPLRYETLLAAKTDDYIWPVFDERAASSICHTSGTSGDPKGGVYSRRSSLLVAMQFTEWVCRGAANGSLESLTSQAPPFHADRSYFPCLAPGSAPGGGNRRFPSEMAGKAAAHRGAKARQQIGSRERPGLHEFHELIGHENDVFRAQAAAIDAAAEVDGNRFIGMGSRFIIK